MSTPATNPHDPDEVTLVSRRGLGVAVGLLTLAFGLSIIAGALEFSVGWGERGPEPGYFPFWIGLVVALASLATIVETWRDAAGAVSPAITKGQLKRALAFFVPMVGFVGLTQVLGLYVASLIYLFGVMVWQGKYSVWLATLVSGGTVVALYLMFDKWLKVPLAKGPIEALLGIH